MLEPPEHLIEPLEHLIEPLEHRSEHLILPTLSTMFRTFADIVEGTSFLFSSLRIPILYHCTIRTFKDTPYMAIYISLYGDIDTQDQAYEPQT